MIGEKRSAHRHYLMSLLLACSVWRFWPYCCSKEVSRLWLSDKNWWEYRSKWFLTSLHCSVAAIMQYSKSGHLCKCNHLFDRRLMQMSLTGYVRVHSSIIYWDSSYRSESGSESFSQLRSGEDELKLSLLMNNNVPFSTIKSILISIMILTCLLFACSTVNANQLQCVLFIYGK